MKIKNNKQLAKYEKKFDKVHIITKNKANKIYRRKLLIVRAIVKYESKLWNENFKTENSIKRMLLYHTN